MKKLVLLALSLFLVAQVFSQQVASPFQKKGNDPVTELHFKQGSGVKNYSVKNERCYTVNLQNENQAKYNLPNDSVFEYQLRKEIELLNSNKANKKADDVYYIPVIVHIIHNGENVGSGSNISQAQVNSQIKVLNEDFRRALSSPGHNNHKDGADAKIEFLLALRDENGNSLSESGIHRVDGNQSSWEVEDINDYVKPNTIWDPTKYLNIWVVNFGGTSSDLLGYAQFPSLSGLDGLATNGGLSKTDGVVMRNTAFGNTGSVQSPYNGGRTATHEIGHWLGLRHIWGDGDCYEDDYCDDTPRAADANYECKKNNSCSKFSGNDMIENYMDYTPDGCMNIFTQDQKERMRAVLETCPRRKELLKSDVATGGGTLPIAFFSADKTEICEGSTIEFVDNSINNPTSWKWRFFDANTNQTVGVFTNQNPKITFNREGVFGLSLVVDNGNGIDSLVDSNYVAVLSSSEQNMPYQEDFESINTFENWLLYNPDNDRTWSETSNASSDGDWSLVFDNYSLYSDPSGTVDAIFSPVIDLSKYKDAYLSFDVAYARYDKEYADTLAFYITDDCGQSFYVLWQKGGGDLATARDTQGYFTPGPYQWATERVYLGDYGFLGKVHIAIVNFSGWGNNIYIDNLELFVPSYTSAPDAYFWSPEDTVTVGSTVVYGDYSSNFPTDWSWSFEGGSPTTANIQTPSVVYNKAGTYDVSLTAANKAGNDNYTVSNYITVVSKPTISIRSESNSYEICKGDSLMLIATGALDYEWYDDRGYLFSFNDTVVVKPFETSNYTAKGTDRFNGFNTALKVVEVVDLPNVYLGNDTSIYLNESLNLQVFNGLNSVKWSDNSAGSNYEFKGADFGIGTHIVTVQAANTAGCIGYDSIAITVLTPTGLKNQNSQFSLNIYPNPSNGNVTMEIEGLSDVVSLSIYTSTGARLSTFNLSKTNNLIEISNMAAGIYLVEYELNGQIYSKKLSVIR